MADTSGDLEAEDEDDEVEAEEGGAGEELDDDTIAAFALATVKGEGAEGRQGGSGA